MTRRMLRAALVAALALAAACWTLDPVHQRLEIRIGADEVVTVVAETRIESRARGEGEGDASSAVERRLDRLRGDLEAGEDGWSRILAPDRCLRLNVSREWEEGRLGSLRREAAMSLDQVPELFRGSDVEAWLAREEQWTELTLHPLPPSRATREQRQAVDEALERFVEAESRYLKAMEGLYAFLAEHPDRSEEIFGRLLDDEGGGEGSNGGDADGLLKEADESMAALADFFFVESGRDGWSMDALVRLVHDPFPAETSLVLPAPPLQAEGFERRDDLTLRVPPVSLRSVIESVQGRWVEPDVVAVALNATFAGREPDLAALAGDPRRAESPGEEEIRAAIAAALAPRGSCRVRWATAPQAGAPER